MTGRVSQDHIDDVLSRVLLSELFAERGVRFRRSGGRHAVRCCFHDDRNPSLIVNDDTGRFRCLAGGCDAHGSAIDLLRLSDGLGFRDALEQLEIRAGMRPDNEGRRIAPRPVVAKVRTEDESEQERAADIARAREIMERSAPGEGTLLETYIRSRGIKPDRIGGIPKSLRFIPDLAFVHSWTDDQGVDHDNQVIWRGPAMVAAITTNDGKLTSVHRTWLAPDGNGKATIPDPENAGEYLPVKKVLVPYRGGAILLGEPARIMQGGEGIENALTGLMTSPGVPAVALGSIEHLAGTGIGEGEPHPLRPGKRLPSVTPDPNWRGWLPPEVCEEFVILADNSSSDANQFGVNAKVERAARRFKNAGLRVRISRAPRGHDLNSLLMAGLRKHGAAA